MTKQKSVKNALIYSVFSVAVCLVMLVSTTFAWFTDSAKTQVNRIVSGNLELKLEYATAWDTACNPTSWANAEGEKLNFKTADQRAQILWEPGCTYDLPELKISNIGNLALKYKVVITGIGGDAELNNVIDWTVKLDGADYSPAAEHKLAAKTADNADYDIMTLSGHMREDAPNTYQNKSIEDISITVYATQDNVEKDSTSNDYDSAALYPVMNSAELKTQLANGGIIAVSNDLKTNNPQDTLADIYSINNPATLNLDAKIISPDNMGDNIKNFVALTINADTTINASANGGINTGVNGGYAINIKNGAVVTINGGSYYGGGTAVQVQKGTLIINGGIFDAEPYSNPVWGSKYVINCLDSAYKDGTAKIIIKGGTFVNFDPSDSASENPHGNFLASGYHVVKETKEDGNIWYTVVKD